MQHFHYLLTINITDMSWAGQTEKLNGPHVAPGPQFAHPWVSVSLWVKLGIYKQCNMAACSHMIATILAVVQQHRHTSQTDHWVPQARVLWCCHGTLTKCSPEQSEWVSSSSRSVCLIRPHFILLLLLQFIAKPSETYIYTYTAPLWYGGFELHRFLQSRCVKSVYPWVREFFTAEWRKKYTFFSK